MRLLGGASLVDERGSIGGRAAQRRRLALLALLARAGPQGWNRDKLTAFLWPEAGPAQARHLLSDSLHVLRRELGQGAVLAVGDALRLNPEIVTCDVDGFEAALGRADPEAAVGLYTGDFLDGFFISGSPEFELWAGAEREHLARAHAEALAALAAAASARDEPREAAVWLRRLIERHPENARAVLDLMRALEASGDWAEAIAHAERHAAYLREELDADPDPVVREHARRLKSAPPRWAPDVSPPKQSQGTDAVPSTTDPDASRRPWRHKGLVVGALALASVAVLLVGSKSLRHAGVELPQTASGESTGANPGIAVLPFTVNDPALDTWREGMVDLLSLNLDGVPNLRAIDNRTILARWDDAVADTARPDLATGLAVARQTGARYALVGSVVAAGVNLQLTADVYEVRGGAKLGRGQVTGSPDSILVLVNRLTMEILRALPREGGVLAEVDLAEVTTDSLAALKAFLNGESFYRRADFKGAAAAFERAIESDPTFALAWDRLGDTCGWSSGSTLCERIPWRWPDEFLSRLPKRRTELLRALYVTVEQGPVEGIAARQQMVRKYPDDPNALYWLGDGYVHFGGWTLVDRAEADRALERAIALAPTTSAEPYIHLIEHAFADADGGRVARLLASYERVTGGAETAYPFRLAFDLGFGDPAIRSRVRAALDTVPTPILWHAMRLLTNPGLHGGSYDEALRVLLARPDHSPDVAFWVFYTRGLGNLRAALDGMNDPAFPPANRALRSYRLYQVGVNFHPEGLERVLAAGAGDTTTAAVYTPTYLLVGAYAVDRGHWDEYADALDRERAWARRQRVEGAYIFARRAEGGVHAMEGYALWKRGHREEAIRTLEAAQRQIWGIEGERHTPPWGPNVIVRWWLGELMLEVGRQRDAERYFKSISADPFAALRLGKVYEDLGAPKQARAAYEYALLSWQHAGSELKPQIETARQGLARQLIR